MSGSPSRKVRDQLQKSLQKERFAEALAHYEALERMEASEPRWPHRKGDLLKRLGRSEEAVRSYERAVDLYAQQGFVARAAAMAYAAVRAALLPCVPTGMQAACLLAIRNCYSSSYVEL